MTTPSDDQIPADDEDRSPDTAPRADGGPGVELGLSDSGGTFEPEEDVAPET